jgi:hypothetical protein
MLALAVAGCGAGDGSSLDEQGRSPAHPYAPGLASKYGSLAFEPSYRGVSEVFFARLCTACHAGASAARGLDLSPAAAYDELVRVPSEERSALARVEPGAPERSYLVIKLAGGREMSGRRMPRNQPARPDDEIERVRTWIAEGAQR